MPRKNLIWLLVLAAVPTGVILLSLDREEKTPVAPGGDDSRFRPVRDAYDYIRRRYYRELEDEQLQQGAVRGMVDGLDEFSAWFPAGAPRRRLYRELTGRRCGIGLVCRFRDTDAGRVAGPAGLAVAGPVAGSPAHRQGIYRGTRILAINGVAAAGLTAAQVENITDGTEGDTITLRMRRPGRTAPETVTLTCAIYPVDTVRGLWRTSADAWATQITPEPARDRGRAGPPKTIYYLRITEFCRRTKPRLEEALGSMVSPAGIIIDLRDNPGGFLDEGVAVADMFLADGVIVRIRRRGGRITVYRAHADTPYTAIPLAVLVNEQTGSAAELVAAALAENCRAVLVGRRTQGKGCVQTMVELDAGLGRLNLTTAEFFTDPDRPIQKVTGAGHWGVEPQVFAAMTPARRDDYRRLRRQLDTVPPPGEHLPVPATGPARGRGSLQRRLLETDTQLARALAIIADGDAYRRAIAALKQRIMKDRRKQENAAPPAEDGDGR